MTRSLSVALLSVGIKLTVLFNTLPGSTPGIYCLEATRKPPLHGTRSNLTLGQLASVRHPLALKITSHNRIP